MTTQTPIAPEIDQLPWASRPLSTGAFTPSADGTLADESFAGVFRFSASTINILGGTPEPVRLGKQVNQFPALVLPFVVGDGLFLPKSRQIHRDTSEQSFWQIIPGPGPVWREPGDDKYCRIGFVFTLGNNIDHLSYHGLGLMVFEPGGNTAGLFYQATPGGVPIELPFGLEMWGYASGTGFTEPQASVANVLTHHREQSARAPHFCSWETLAGRCPGELLEALRDGVGAQTTVTFALATSEEIYVAAHHTPYGEHPDIVCLRQGIWSATKSAGAGVALLFLAERYGAEILDLLVADLLEVTASHDGWKGVRLRDCFNMASGIGDLHPQPHPPDIFADYDMIYEGDSEPLKRYLRWFRAPSQLERVDAAFSCGSYPWEPGQVVRYRDQDFFVLAASLHALVKEREGSDADLWSLIERDVYDPIGLQHAVVNRTVEPDGSKGVPLLGGGLFLTLTEAARVAALYHRLGEHAGQQLLHRASVEEIVDPSLVKGLPTGMHNEAGEIRYHMGFWHRPFRTRGGRLLYLPTMFGYGGNEIVLLPNQMTAIRFGFDNPKDETAYDVMPLVRVASAWRAFD